jgi:hypothetical protein
VNLAFPALVIFLCALPGVLLRTGYRRGINGSWKNPFVIQSIADEVAWSIGFSIALHFLFIGTWSRLFGRVDLAPALALMASTNTKDELVAKAIANTASHAAAVACYFLTIYLVSYSIGLIGHYIVRMNGLDHRYRVFRFDNPWFYLLSGESIDIIFPEKKRWAWKWRLKRWPLSGPRKVDIVRISAAVKQGSEVYLYVGRLESFEFDRSGQLDSLILNQVSRRLLSADLTPGKQVNEAGLEEESRFYPIQTLHFVIRYADICTLNVEYILLRQLPNQA